MKNHFYNGIEIKRRKVNIKLSYRIFRYLFRLQKGFFDYSIPYKIIQLLNTTVFKSYYEDKLKRIEIWKNQKK